LNRLKIKTDIMLHIRQNIVLYLVVVFAFITGVASGGFTVSSITEQQRLYLGDYLKGYSYLLDNQPYIDKSVIFLKSVLQNLQTAFFIWLFGLSYLGIPLVLITIGVRGFFLGFTAAFLIDYYSLNGFLIVATCILPQSFIYIPSIVIMGVLALQFGVESFGTRKLRYLKRAKLQRIAPYTSKFLIIVIAFIIGSLFEAFVAPVVFKLLFSNVFAVKDFIALLSNKLQYGLTEYLPCSKYRNLSNEIFESVMRGDQFV